MYIRNEFVSFPVLIYQSVFTHVIRLLLIPRLRSTILMLALFLLHPCPSAALDLLYYVLHGSQGSDGMTRSPLRTECVAVRNFDHRFLQSLGGPIFFFGEKDQKTFSQKKRHKKEQKK
jgi:hypothetical protein